MVPEQQLQLVPFQSSQEGLGCDICLKRNECVRFVVLNSLEKSALKQKASNKTKKPEEIINKKQLVSAGKNIYLPRFPLCEINFAVSVLFPKDPHTYWVLQQEAQ